MILKVLLILLIIYLAVGFFIVYQRKKNWLPLIILVILWYVPRQTAPGGWFESLIYLRWISYGIILALLVLFLFDNVSSGLKSFREFNVFIPILLFSITWISSGIYNDSSLFAIVLGILNYIRYPLLFYIFLNIEFDDSVTPAFLKLFFFLVIIQIPESFIRYFMGYRWDNLSYTLGSYGTFDLGVYAIMATCLLAVYGVNIRFKAYHVLFYLSMYFIAIAGEIKAYILGAPIMTICSTTITIIQQRINFTRRMLFNFVLAALMLLFSIIAINVFESFQIGRKNILDHYIDKFTYLINPYKSAYVYDPSLERTAGLFHLLNNINLEFDTVLVGFGPGSSFVGTIGEAGKRTHLIAFMNQITAILLDCGLLGLIFYYLFLINLLRMILKTNMYLDDKRSQVIAAALFGYWIFYSVLGPFYVQIWRHDSSNYIFYFLLSSVFVKYRKEIRTQ